MSSESNPQLDLAFDYVRYTNRHVFLTGKAGTGKTTFLHKIKAEGFKRMVVTAPTGVAAINAGGMTLHSFFQLPFGMYIPGASRDETTRRRFSKEKINLIKTLELLVIDEISMVRADLLDAVDDVLRRYADRSQPFGGVQLLMIGDLHQLPPVVKPEEWDVLGEHYESPYFFSSQALKKTEMVPLELQKIYRQSDEVFIQLLNRLRHNELGDEVLNALNSRYRPESQALVESGYITLTSHNAAAANINAQKLEAVDQPIRRFSAQVEGEFPEMAYPTDAILQFKKGAQVMFVKNDAAPQKRFFNGKIGTIKSFGDGEIVVRSKDDSSDIVVTPAEWQNIRYSLHPETKEIREELLGTFKQYPLKLAWAITIHKSQGLTFDKVVIDAAAAFAHGQVYVALSRCRSLEGIVLSSRIQPRSVKTDRRVSAYTSDSARNAPDEQHLRESKRRYQCDLVRELFRFGTIRYLLQQLSRTFRSQGNALSPEGLLHFRGLCEKFDAEIVAVTEKFLPQLNEYLAQSELPEENPGLCQRIQKAAVYFSSKLHDGTLPQVRSIQLVTDDKAVRKVVDEYLDKLQQEIFAKHACFAASGEGFSTAAYLKAKKNAELQFVTERRVSATAVDRIPKDVSHPELYAQLLQWRGETAENLGVTPREVLRTRSLRELTACLPTKKSSLKRIPGIGAVKVSEFGEVLIRMIEAYCKAHNVGSDLLASEKKNSAADTKRLSLELYQSGKTIEEIAAARGLVTSTIEGHLAHFIAQRELNVLDFMSQEELDEMTRYFAASNSLSLQEAKMHFEGKHSYGLLRMALEHFRAQT
jgi:hypothetical protein